MLHRQAFQYGSLASRATVTLAMYRNLKGYSLDSEGIEVLRDATDFMDRIIAGEKLLSGERGGASAAGGDGKLLGYAFETSELLNRMWSPEVRTYFRSIKDGIVELVRQPHKRLPENEINRLYGFFSALSDLFTGEVQLTLN